MKVAVQLVTWNGGEYMATLLPSLQAQTLADWELWVLDNASSDTTVAQIEKSKQNTAQSIYIIKEKENIGFAPAHVTLFEQTKSDYVLVLNQDTLLEPDMLEKLVTHLDAHPNVSSVSPRLMRLENGQKTNYIDSLGVAIKRSRQVVDRKAGEVWSGTMVAGAVETVFGVSGAIALYRRSALEKVGFFDPSYFAYKEDVDLAWRLVLAGFSNCVVINAVAYHARSVRTGSKKTQSSAVRYYSYKNHLATVYKNEQCANFLIDFLFILWYELLKLVYIFCTDWKTLSGLGQLLKNRRELKKQRVAVQKITGSTWQEMRKWFSRQ